MKKYQLRTQLIHGEFRSPKWDYSHHIVPPMTASAAYRLEGAERGADGLPAFANPEFNPAAGAHLHLRPARRAHALDARAQPRGGRGRRVRSASRPGMAAITAASACSPKAATASSRTTRSTAAPTRCSPTGGPASASQRVRRLQRPGALERRLTDDVMVVYFETPINPTLEIVDIARRPRPSRGQRARGKRRRILIVVDNTFATPFCQRPLALGRRPRRPVPHEEHRRLRHRHGRRR